MGTCRIKPDQITRVREVLAQTGCIQETARVCKVSYYTAWRVSRGMYDENGNLVRRPAETESQEPAAKPRGRYFKNNRCWLIG